MPVSPGNNQIASKFACAVHQGHAEGMMALGFAFVQRTFHAMTGEQTGDFGARAPHQSFVVVTGIDTQQVAMVGLPQQRNRIAQCARCATAAIPGQ